MGPCSGRRTRGDLHAGVPQTSGALLEHSARLGGWHYGGENPDLPGEPTLLGAQPQPPLLLPWPRGVLGGLPGPLPPQPHKHLGLPITLPALQQLQDGIPCGERRLGVRLRRGEAVPG